MSEYQDQLMTCFEISKAVASTLNMRQILDILLKRLSELLRAQNWTLYLLDEKRQELNFEVVVGLDDGSLSDIRIKLGEGIAGTVAKTGEPILVPERVHKDTRFSSRVDDMTGFVTQSLICLPLKIEGQVLGVIELINPEDRSLFDDRFLPVLSILSDFMAIAIANARNHKRIESLAVTDDVTGYHNTRFLHDCLDELIGNGQKVSLAFLDLDEFKDVVDTHGHLLGSKMLKEVAGVVASCLEANDSLVRYGGDEYIIILPDQNKTDAGKKVARIRRAMTKARFLRSEGLSISISASYGIASYPGDAAEKTRLLQLADEAMYHSKKTGKNKATLA
jgi:diguanylate cyclase (GGDEF)-like protein